MSITDNPDTAHSALGLLCMKAIEQYKLERYGDHLADANKYKEHSGLDAIRYYMFQKGKVSASQARTLSVEDLVFCVAEDLEAWSLPSGEYAVSNKFFAAVAGLTTTSDAMQRVAKKLPKRP